MGWRNIEDSPEQESKIGDVIRLTIQLSTAYIDSIANLPGL